jgi:hypothetical protein
MYYLFSEWIVPIFMGLCFSLVFIVAIAILIEIPSIFLSVFIFACRKQRNYHESGYLAHEGKLFFGRRIGFHSFYNESGLITRKINYFRGKEIEVQYFFPQSYFFHRHANDNYPNLNWPNLQERNPYVIKWIKYRLKNHQIYEVGYSRLIDHWLLHEQESFFKEELDLFINNREYAQLALVNSPDLMHAIFNKEQYNDQEFSFHVNEALSFDNCNYKIDFNFVLNLINKKPDLSWLNYKGNKFELGDYFPFLTEEECRSLYWRALEKSNFNNIDILPSDLRYDKNFLKNAIPSWFFEETISDSFFVITSSIYYQWYNRFMYILDKTHDQSKKTSEESYMFFKSEYHWFLIKNSFWYAFISIILITVALSAPIYFILLGHGSNIEKGLSIIAFLFFFDFLSVILRLPIFYKQFQVYLNRI